MNFNLLNIDIQDFINKNLNSDIVKLALQKNSYQAAEWNSILNQISCKAKAKLKLPTFFATENIIYPSKISLEQTSSEKTAKYKADLISGNSLIDLTGGFGVDAVFFSKSVKNVVHCELNTNLSEIAKHNFKALKIDNIQTICGDGFTILENQNQNFDWIYIDPSRRNDEKGKVFMLKDCLPNVPDLMSDYFKHSNNILLKTAPILDISAGLLELKNVKEIHIVAVENEVKELLWVLEKNYIENISIQTANLFLGKTELFSFLLNDDSKESPLDFPQKYLYEPNAAIMKSGGFDKISHQYNLSKLHQNSHLYTSDILIEFPGRVFEIIDTFGYSKTNMNAHFKNKKANISVRNFSETVDDIRKKWKIKDGGELFCFFTTDLENKKIVVLGKKIKI